MSQRQANYIKTSAFPEPNYTQTPNNFFDMLPDMQHSEVNVTLVLIRETFGYHRTGCKMGLNKLANAAGLSRNATKDGAEAAEKRGTFKRSNPDSLGEAEWELVIGQPVTTPHSVTEGSQPVTIDRSTSDSQVGVKENKEIKINNSLSIPQLQEVKDEANRKVDAILGMTKGQEGYWQGRELIRADLLPLADWYNKATNQVMTKRAQKSWWKALGEWKEAGLLPEHLQAAFEAQSKWRMVSDPNMLTRDAEAVKASGAKEVKPKSADYKPQPRYDERGGLISY